MSDAKKKLKPLLEEFGFLERSYCSKEENRIAEQKRKAAQPSEEELFRDPNGDFYHLRRSDLSEEDFDLYLRLKTAHILSEIRTASVFCVAFLFFILVWLLSHV